MFQIEPRITPNAQSAICIKIMITIVSNEYIRSERKDKIPLRSSRYSRLKNSLSEIMTEATNTEFVTHGIDELELKTNG